MSEEKNSDVFLRPRFKMDVDECDAHLIKQFKSGLNNDSCKYYSKIVESHIIIDIPSNEEHFWSPQLNIEIVKGASGKSIVKGLFGPKPQVWTLFMFLHFAVGITFLIFLTLLYVRWTFESSLLFPTIMVVILPILWVVLYFLGRWGRNKGKDQIQELHTFMMGILEI